MQAIARQAIQEDNYEGFPIVCGCRPGGIDKECNNCCALRVAQALTGRKGKMAENYKQVTNKINGKRVWNGQLRENFEVFDRLNHIGRSRNLLAVYTGEIALARPLVFVRLIKAIYEFPIHTFTILTKFPALLFAKMAPAFKYAEKARIDITKLDNLRIATSIGSDEFKYRIKELKKFLGIAPLEIWYKPLIGSVINPDYKGIDRIRINCEKGNNARGYQQEWVDNIIKAAKKQDVEVYCDIKK